MCFVYMLRCADDTYYIGSTSDITRRIIEHNTSPRGAHYTKIRRPVVVVYSEPAASLGAARSREASLKKLTRAQKEQLCK